jgi:hypothetical protein
VYQRFVDFCVHRGGVSGAQEATAMALLALRVRFEWQIPSVPLLADTESAENYSEQIVRTKLAGNRVQLILRETQFLGEQIQRL